MEQKQWKCEPIWIIHSHVDMQSWVGLKPWNFSDIHSAGDINAEDETTVIVNNAEL